MMAVRLRRVFGSGTAHVIIPFAVIVGLSLIVYSNSFDVPFQFDDKPYIVQNPIIKDPVPYLLGPDRDWRFYDTLHIFEVRTIGYLSFAFNYRIHGLDVSGYHIFNYLVHLMNAVLVYMLVLLLLKTPKLKGSLLQRHTKSMALLTSLLFVCHPLQTQAITYITQRFASLATMFYIGAVLLYVKWRLAEGSSSWGRNVLYVLCLASTALAMKTKEIAFSLPAMLAVVEVMFFHGPRGRRLLGLAPLAACMLIIPLGLISLDKPLSDAVSEATRTQHEISRSQYFLTQFGVAATYLRLLFLPMNQSLDYDYPLYGALFEPAIFLPMSLIAGLLAFCVRAAASKGSADMRLISFGVIWFFLGLSVESSFVAMENLIFEHRVYLPSAGFFMALTAGVFIAFQRFGAAGSGARVGTFLFVAALVFGLAAHERNGVWKSEVSLWEDVVRKAPGKPRGHYNLGLYYYGEGRFEDAIREYKMALLQDPDYVEAHNNLGTAYGSIGMMDMAIRHFNHALSIAPDDVELNYNLGIAYHHEGFIDEAIICYQNTLKLKPDLSEAHYYLGTAYHHKGLIDKAVRCYVNALRLDPNDVEPYIGIGLVYLDGGELERAGNYLGEALRIDPDHQDARLLFERVTDLLSIQSEGDS